MKNKLNQDVFWTSLGSLKMKKQDEWSSLLNVSCKKNAKIVYYDRFCVKFIKAACPDANPGYAQNEDDFEVRNN